MKIKIDKVICVYNHAVLVSDGKKTLFLETDLAIFAGLEYDVVELSNTGGKARYGQVTPLNYHFYTFYTLFKYAGDTIDFKNIIKRKNDLSSGKAMLKVLNLKKYNMHIDSTPITAQLLDEFIMLVDTYYETLGVDTFNMINFYAFSFIYNSDNINIEPVVKIMMSNSHVPISAFLRDPYYMAIFDIQDFGEIDHQFKDQLNLSDTIVKRLAFADNLMKEALDNNLGYVSEKEFSDLYKRHINKTAIKSANAKELLELAIEYGIIKLYKGKYYLTHIISYEKIIHHKVNILINMQERYHSKLDVSKTQIDKYTLKDYGYKHSPSQIKAIQKATNSKYGIVAISGGAGTGKTTVTKTILHILRKKYKITNNEEILALAPTGKASAGLGKNLGLKGNTLDSALLNGSIKKARLIIVDEAGMMSLSLMFRLMTQVRPTTKVILLGDKNQLPSVDFGCVFRDIELRSKVSFSELTEIHRQSDGSRIIDVAAESIHPTKNGVFKSDKDVFITDYKGVDDFLLVIKKLGFYDNPHKMQIIVPTNKSAKFGTNILNKKIQEERCRLAGLDRHQAYEGFYEGDKVIVMKKDIHRPIVNIHGEVNPDFYPGVENGDQGIVISVRQFGIIVDIGNGKYVLCRREDGSIQNLSLAYAITIHKSQGAQWPTVFFLNDGTPSSNRMLSRELIYTAITRAESALFMNITEKDFYAGAARSSINERVTTLFL